MKKAILLIVVAAVVASAAGWFILGRREAIPVKTIKVEKGEITSTLSATGRLVSKQEAEISPSMAGQVQAVYVNEGDVVSPDAVLALLDDRELREKVAAAEQSLREANEKVRQMKREHEALSMIYQAGGTSRQSVEDARSNLEIALATSKKATADLNGFKIAIDKAQVKAPFGGIVTRKAVNPGEWASPGAAIFSLAKESPREIEVMVDESDAGLVKAGQPVDLTSEAFPGKSWREQITEVSPAVKKEGGANSVKVRVSHGTDAPALKLGQQVDAKIQTGHRVDIAKLPFECIINVGGKTSVAIPKGGAIRFAPVDTGIEDAISVEIVRGVSMGEEVILPEGKQLKEGERIRIVTKEPSRQ